MDTVDAPRPRKRQLLSPDFVRAMLAGHSALGLAFAALIYVVCLTGTIAVFMHDFARWEQPSTPILAQAITPEAVGAAVNAAYAQAKADGAAHDIFVTAPTAANPRLEIHYHDHETGIEGHWLADQDGRLVARSEAHWSEFVSLLHKTLHLPATWGLFVVGLTGVALLSSLVSGLLSHPRIFKDAFALRWGGSRRLQEADLHNRLGVWGLPFHFVVSLSGALLGLSVLIIGVLAMAAYEGDSEKAFAMVLGPHATNDETPAPVPDVAQMVRHVQQERPGAVFAGALMQHVGEAGQVVHLRMRTPGHLAFGNAYYFKGDGTPLGDGGYETGSIGQQIVGVLQPVHFGWFGGWPVKVIYGFLGLALTIITHNGVLIWFARRRDKGRPVPVWERVWAAIGWGQPLALAASAIAALVLGEGVALGVYLTAAGVALVIAGLLANAEAIVRALRLLSAVCLVGAVATQVVLRGTAAPDPMAFIVNGALLLCAVLVALPAVRARVGKRAAAQAAE